MAKDEILISQLFAGSYLEAGENIGHEFINLFAADDGNHYLYIPPNGIVGGHYVQDVIFVRNYKPGTVEVIAVASGLEPDPVPSPGEIEYAGLPLERLFRGNVYHDEEGEVIDDDYLRVTFQAQNLKAPAGNRRIFLTLDPESDSGGISNLNPEATAFTLYLDSTRKTIRNQSLRCYYSTENDARAYRALRDLIDEESLWAPHDEGIVLEGAGPRSAHVVAGAEPTLIEVIRKEDDELVFSNLLAYFFEYSHEGFREFAGSVLGIEDMDEIASIKRESKYNVDLWVESEKYVIVIENKIKSGINGITDSGGSQLEKYYQKAVGEAGRDRCRFFVFAPVYSSLDISQHNPEDAYRLIGYDQIYSFFADEDRRNRFYADSVHYQEFLKGLERHTKTMAELNFDTMRTRFLRRRSSMLLDSCSC